LGLAPPVGLWPPIGAAPFRARMSARYSAALHTAPFGRPLQAAKPGWYLIEFKEQALDRLPATGKVDVELDKTIQKRILEVS